MKIYTGSGDRGMTSLFSGERVKKSYERVETYGDVDELNSVLGTLIATLPEDSGELAKEIQHIQSDLLSLGAWLATTPDSPSLAFITGISEAHVTRLELAIDRMMESLAPLRGFILPGGHISSGLAHIARTVCRRAERHILNLTRDYSGTESEKQFKRVIAFLNRLSDYLFVLARYCNHMTGLSDTTWEK
ncbi:MAG: cob(I)yrinic acid a,c-diamide adenosyltransferase [Desulfobacterales bacterium]|jgi:cob(I)alamin adenosyltransferase